MGRKRNGCFGADDQKSGRRDTDEVPFTFEDRIGQVDFDSIPTTALTSTNKNMLRKAATGKG
jgi:hypothetical protein